MKSTTAIGKIKTEFSLQNAISFGGVKIFLSFLEKIKLADAMCSFSGGKARNSLFPVHGILLYLIVGWMLGCERIFHFRRLQGDALLKRFFGGRCPHHSLLYKDLTRLGHSCPDLVNELRTLNLAVIGPCLPDDLILDLDSTVETVYGDQSGAAKGTNPHKPGRKSYHPLLAFEGQSRLSLNAALRPGNTHSSTDATDFLQQTFGLLGEHKVKYARFDKGFGGEDFYSLWEQKDIGYVGKLKWTQRLAKEVQTCRYWKRYVDEDWIIEGISMIYKATSWNKARRVAVIRKAQVFDQDQGRIVFDTDWRYEAIVTNLEWEANDLWRFYNQRCCMENYIKEAKNGFSIDRIATSDFKANELDLLIKLFAYNLFERFKRDCCEPVHQGYTIARFRLEFFHCAATLIRHGRSVVLKLMKDFASRYAWKRIESRVAQLE
ncbi:IS1380 family transposase [Paenibacillus sp. JMULE4]|uniref:IS1380 family transposase n=1 Tax=Paenibacillus validus TaxID=44253 RepID=A0A7X3CTQ8_9BACL|nr:MULTISPECIES: IS1380 family transposase [Paenibacillus]MUG73060.1 IS1380 family transposase [Paenibacillus validus]NTZ19468.1 IS1380 family transposase [Paenibacillus sp. JMULE4]